LNLADRYGLATHADPRCAFCANAAAFIISRLSWVRRDLACRARHRHDAAGCTGFGTGNWQASGDHHEIYHRENDRGTGAEGKSSNSSLRICASVYWNVLAKTSPTVSKVAFGVS